MITIRNYNSDDFNAVRELYFDTTLYGGQFDEHRDSKAKLDALTARDPEAILVAEVVGSVSLIEDRRVAWLFRFAVKSDPHEDEVIMHLFTEAKEVLLARGHTQVLVYAPANNSKFDARYHDLLQFEVGGEYTCYWKDL